MMYTKKCVINVNEIKYFVLPILSKLETQVEIEESEYTLGIAAGCIKDLVCKSASYLYIF